MAKATKTTSYTNLWSAFRREKRAWLSVSDDGLIFFGIADGNDTKTIRLTPEDVFTLRKIFDILDDRFGEVFMGRIPAELQLNGGSENEER